MDGMHFWRASKPSSIDEIGAHAGGPWISREMGDAARRTRSDRAAWRSKMELEPTTIVAIVAIVAIFALTASAVRRMKLKTSTPKHKFEIETERDPPGNESD